MNMIFRKSTPKRRVFASFALLALTGGIASQIFTGEVFAQIPFAQGTIAQNTAPQAAQINWQNDINAAAVSAKNEQKLIFVHFYGNNCPPCKAMDAEVYTDPRVIAGLNQQFIPVKIDTGLRPELVKQFGIKAIPTDLVLDENGKVFDKRQGGISADRFCQYLGYLQAQRIGGAASPAQNNTQNQTAGFAPPVQNNAQGQQIAAYTPQPVQPAPASQVVPQPAASQPQPVAAHPAAAVPIVLNDPFLQQPAAQPPQPVQANPAAAVAANQPAVQQTVQGQQTTVQQAEVAKSPNPMRSAEPAQTGGLTSPAQNTAAKPAAQVAAVLPENCETVKPSMVELPLALDGYCPVVLTNEERWTQGNPQFYAMFQGLVYHFSSEKAMQTFIENPLKYAPAVKSEDIVFLADRNKKILGSRKFGAWFEGRVYLFSCQEALNVFAAKPEHYAAVAKQQETAIHTSLNTVQR